MPVQINSTSMPSTQSRVIETNQDFSISITGEQICEKIEQIEKNSV